MTPEELERMASTIDEASVQLASSLQIEPTSFEELNVQAASVETLTDIGTETEVFVSATCV